MKIHLGLLTVLLHLSFCQAQEDYQLEYVFELVRHGARAQQKNDTKFTIVPSEMLTPQGMRQRFLLGRMNYVKYAKPLGVENNLTHGGVWMMSTDIYRTVQSSYSELTGLLYEQRESLKNFITQAQLD